MAISNSMKTIILAVLATMLLFIGLRFVGIDSAALFNQLFGLATSYILPWVALYWLIRLVKAVESRR